MAMSNVNNRKKVKKLPRAQKQQEISNLLREEFGVEKTFDSKHFDHEKEFSTKDKAESERTAWNQFIFDMDLKEAKA